MNIDKIENYIKKHPQMDFKNIVDVAHKIDVSTSALTRFCKVRGYDGFKQFGQLIREYHGHKKSELDQLIHSLKTTGKMLDQKKLKFIASKIFQAQQVFILGESFTFLQAKIFESKLLRININAKVINIASELSLLLPKPQSVYIFISHTGRNYNTRLAFNKIKNAHLPSLTTFSITANSISIIKNEVNECLFGHTFGSGKDSKAHLPANSIMVMQLILDQLFQAVYNMDAHQHQNLLSQIKDRKKSY